MTDILEPQAPANALPAIENTIQTTPAPVPADLEQKVKELEAQKEHWRTKYERDITNVPINNPEPPTDQEAFSDEGKLLEQKIKALESSLSEVKQDSAKKDVLITHPILKEKWDDFESFREQPDNKGMNLKTAAKAYMIENGMMDTPRKGLEQTTGGTRTAPQTGMTADDVKTLRETNFKKYQDMLTKGLIKID